MKCPKCGYLGFDRADRCRNCGYEFALAEPVALPELPLRSEATAVEPADDLSLGHSAELSHLPLFGGRLADDAPLIAKASPPRPPLAVRRATPEPVRTRPQPARLLSLDLALDLDRLSAPTRVGASERPGHATADTEADLEDAGLFRRVGAGLADILILLAIDVIVIYFTLEICGVSVADFGLLPKGPLVAFLVVQNVGYLVAFTAGGQTLGKMAAGIKVVSVDSQEPVDVGCAVKRAAVWLVLAFPAGLGFLTACLSRDHRGLHDRFAGTRVVRGSV
jgi:uncharacterized RDD family membrane protein YckC